MPVRVTLSGLAFTNPDGRYRKVGFRPLLGAAFLAFFGMAIGLLIAQVQSNYLLGQMLLGGKYTSEAAGFALSRQKAALGALLTSRARPNDSLPKVEIFLSNNTLADMIRHRAVDGSKPDYGAYVRAHEPGPPDPGRGLDFLPYDTPTTRVKVASRGLSPHHYQSAKPSLRVTFPKSEAQGRRHWELQVPEDPLLVANLFPELFAREVGLMTGLSRVVQVSINRKDVGLYLDCYRLDEPLALVNGRLPGMFFKGDYFEHRLWEHRRAWKASGEIMEGGWKQLDGLLQLVSQPSWSSQDRARFDQLVDIERYAQWCALATLTGSVHADDYHNHVYFYSSYTGKLEPVVWDFNSWILTPPFTHVDRLMNRMQILAYHDPKFMHRRNEILYRWLSGPGSPQAWAERLKAHLAPLLPALSQDPNLGALKRLIPPGRKPENNTAEAAMLFPLPVAPQELPVYEEAFRSWNEERAKFLRAYLADSAIYLGRHQKGTVISSAGRVAVRVKSRSGLVHTPEGGFPEILAYPGMAFSDLQTDIPLPGYTTLPARLDYSVSNPPEDLLFENALDGTPIEPRFEACPIPVGFSLPPLPVPAAAREPVELGPGRVVLTQDLVVESTQNLIIHPGTQIFLAPGKGLYSQGKVLAEGTRDKPITVRPLDPASPFAAFAIWSESTAGSRFTWFDIEGGSTGDCRGVFFKGMFDVYQCPDLKLTDFRAGKSFLGDDAANLGNCNVDLTRLSFENALADSLDMDACKGRVTDSTFRSSGNDGIDLSTCEVDIEDCQFFRCGDKGISVGEGSRATIRNCVIRECVSGIAAKDRSVALVEDSRLESCQAALRAYRKKWSFVDGGTLILERTAITPWRPSTVVLDRYSRLYWPDYPTAVKPGSRVRKFSLSVDEAANPSGTATPSSEAR